MTCKICIKRCLRTLTLAALTLFLFPCLGCQRESTEAPHTGAQDTSATVAQTTASTPAATAESTTSQVELPVKTAPGLDITDRTDLVSICYTVWFDAILTHGTAPITDWANVTEILAGKQDWAPAPSFHYWAKPALGYYRSSDKQVIRTHMTQLGEAGVDFIIVDLTNASDGYLQSDAWYLYIQRPMDAICRTITAMRAEGKTTPYVVFWCGPNCGTPIYQKLYDRYLNSEDWADCFVFWDEKPFLITVNMPEDFPLPELYTVRAMWGLGTVKYDKGQWSFLSIDSYGKFSPGPDGKPEQVSVAVASQETYMSLPTAHGREGGVFWYKQWYNAFEIRPKIVTLTWWNEWVAQRLEIAPGVYRFTDNYNQAYSRDIEPMEGGHGDQYYRWMVEYIAAYKGGLPCPILYEESTEHTAAIEAFHKRVGKPAP